MKQAKALFIDGANTYATSKALGFDIDYRKLLKYFGENLIRAYYYTAMIEDSTEDVYISIRPLVDWLAYNGYNVVSKPAKQFMDGGRMRIKGNMDCEMTVDALELAGELSEAVFFTGDGDFKALLLALQRRGVRNTVVSSIKTKPAICADELRRIADTFIDLADLEPAIKRDERINKYG